MNFVSLAKITIIRRALILSLTLCVFACPAFAQTRNEPVLGREKTGYAVGVGIGRNMKNLDIDIDPDMVLRGIRDAVRGKIALSDQDIKAALDAYEKDVLTKLSAKNRRDGEAFLRENRQRQVVTTLPSGLQYWVLKEGTGPVPKTGDIVILHYRARLVDGYEFESSYWKNKPAEIVVDKAIKGWREALTKMPAGSTWRLYIPSELAYGEAGAGQFIGPNAVLICDLELISIK